MSGTLRRYKGLFKDLGLDVTPTILDAPLHTLEGTKQKIIRRIIKEQGIEGVKNIKKTRDIVNKICEEDPRIKNDSNKSYIEDGITIELIVYQALGENIDDMIIIKPSNNKPNNKPSNNKPNNKPPNNKPSNNKPNNKPIRKIIYNPEDEPNNQPTRKMIYNPEDEPNNQPTRRIIHNPEDEPNTKIAYTNNTLRISNTRKGGRRKGRRYSRKH